MFEGQCEQAPVGNVVAFTRTSTRNLLLSGKKQFTLRARHNLLQPLSLDLVLAANNKPPCRVHVTLEPAPGFRRYVVSLPEDWDPGERITKLALEVGAAEHFVLEFEQLGVQ